jgi:hypothetical protein
MNMVIGKYEASFSLDLASGVSEGGPVELYDRP